MSWSNICSAVSSSSQWHASRAQRDARGWTWETKAQESIWGSRPGCARTKGQLWNSFGRCWRRRQPVYNSATEKEGERRASPQKSPTKHTMRPQWRMNYSRRLRPVHRQKMAVFHLQNVSFWGVLKKPSGVQNDNWGLWNPLTYGSKDARPRTCARTNKRSTPISDASFSN